ncbi:MAG: GNAT family N-acetyltransferase [Lutibacter sp.]
MLEVIDDIKILYDLKLELEVVYSKHVGWSFNSPTFFLTAYKEFQFESDKTHLFFIIMRENNKIVSYIPLYIDQKKTLRFIFDEHTDFCGVIGQKPNFNFFKDLSKVILNESKINKISLDNLLPDDSLLNHLKNFLGVGTAISCYNNHSFITSTTAKDFLGHLKSKEISELKRVRNKNKEYDFEVFDGGKVFPETQMKVLRDQMIANKTRSTDFLDDAFLSFSKVLYDAGELEVFTKWDKEQLVSSSIVLKNSKSNYRMVWIDLFANMQFLNMSAYVDYIHHLEKYSPSVFNFGRGSYDYKAKNFHPHIQNLYNLRYSKSKFDFLFTNYYLLKYFLKRIIKK